MNYRRGLFRIWLVFTALWVGGHGYDYLDTSYRLYNLEKVNLVITERLKTTKDESEIQTSKNTNEIATDFRPRLIAELESDKRNAEERIKFLGNEKSNIFEKIFPLPLGLLFAYFLFDWIRKGFRQGD